MDQSSRDFRPRILVAPLDWGLGHATRSIPIVRELLKQGADVCLAASGATLTLLSMEFPELEKLPLKGYRVRYPRTGWLLLPGLTMQIPKIFRAMQYEKLLLARWVKSRGFHAIISDNRYGLHNPELSSVIITHQLEIKTGLGKWADGFLRRLHYRFIRRFDECWVPDCCAEPSLAGALSHPSQLPPMPVHYLGPQSRFEYSPHLKDQFILILLSGPEPQRSIFEEMVLSQIAALKPKRFILVRGLPGAEEGFFETDNLEVHSHLETDVLQSLISTASLVVCRSGYSTVMDLAVLKARALLVPTPSQTEQEYLARHLEKICFAPFVKQEDFSLRSAMEMAERFEYHLPSAYPSDLLSDRITQFLQGLRNTR